jgi:hypothetical protein
MTHNFQIGKNKIKLLTEYESVNQNVLFGNAVLAALLSGRKYDVIIQNGRWVGRYGPIPWPPRSPAITPLDFFLWRYVKNIVYKTL